MFKVNSLYKTVLTDVKSIGVVREEGSKEMYTLQFKDMEGNSVVVQVGHLLRDFIPNIREKVESGIWAIKE